LVVESQYDCIDTAPDSSEGRWTTLTGTENYQCINGLGSTTKEEISYYVPEPDENKGCCRSTGTLTSTIVNKDTMIDGEEVDFRRSNDTII